MEDIADAGDELGGKEGVATKLKEVVMNADAGEAKELGKEGGNHLFGGRAGRNKAAIGYLVVSGGKGQGLTIQLAVGGKGEGIEQDEGGREHVVGELGLEELAQGGAGGGGVGLRDDVGDQALVPGWLVVDLDDG